MTAPTLMPVAPLAAAFAKVVDWADQLDLPQPAEVILHHRALATGGHVTIIVADVDDLFLWAQALDGGVMDIPVELDAPGMAFGSVFDLPVFVRTEVVS